MFKLANMIKRELSQGTIESVEDLVLNLRFVRPEIVDRKLGFEVKRQKYKTVEDLERASYIVCSLGSTTGLKNLVSN